MSNVRIIALLECCEEKFELELFKKEVEKISLTALKSGEPSPRLKALVETMMIEDRVKQKKREKYVRRYGRWTFNPL